MTKRISVEQMPPVENEEQKRHLVRYVNFINSRPERKLKQKGFETHHIYPKSIAKKNNIEDYDGNLNLIELTSREHFIAHMILFYCGYKEMTFAFFRIINCHKYHQTITSRQYDKLIKNQRDILKEKLSNTVWVNNGLNSKQVKLNEIPDGWRIGMAGDRQWITNGYDNKMISEDSDVDDGWRLGMTTDVKDYRLITDGNTTKYLYENEIMPKGWRYGSLQNKQYVTWINNGQINKRWDVSKQLPDGFIFGRIVNGFFITNGKIAKKVNNESEIPFGWRKGRLKRTKEQIKNNLTI